MTPWFFHLFYPKTLFANCTLTSPIFEVRVAISSDLHSISKIIADSFHSRHGIWGWILPLLHLSIYEDLRQRLALRNPHYICLVAVNSPQRINHLIGTVEMTLRFSDSFKKRLLTLYCSSMSSRNRALTNGAIFEYYGGEA